MDEDGATAQSCTSLKVKSFAIAVEVNEYFGLFSENDQKVNVANTI